MIKHIHVLARYTALILISALPMPYDDANAETSEKQIAAIEALDGKTLVNYKQQPDKS
jgi:hypothetical protein